MKNILVTGANGGMGKATCKLLSSSGYNVFGVDLSDADDFVGTRFFKADLSDSNQILAIKDQLRKECNQLHAIIHMAGIYDLNSLVEMSEDDFLRVFQANLFSVYRINKIFMPMLCEGSRVIITSSELACLDPLPFTGIYAVSKGALEKYAFSLRMELNLLGIDVSVIRPGAVKTGLLDVSTAALDRFCQRTELYKCNAERFKKIVDSVENKNIPAQRIADIALKILKKKNPRYVYNINRNPGLRLLSVLPDRLQVKIISLLLKQK